MTKDCTVCHQGTITAHEELESVYFYGITGDIRTQYSTCSHCGVHTSEEQSIFNAVEVRAFKDQALKQIHLGG